MTDANLDALEAEAAAIAATGKRPPLRQAIPIRHVENLQLAPITPQSIRKMLQGGQTRAGVITGIEWFLIDHDAFTAIYEAQCPYPFCNGEGTIMASTRLDRHGMAELPFSDPGALQCSHCDGEIETRYNAEAVKMRNPRRASAKREDPTATWTAPGRD
ncbi:hypothetical protein [Aestuariivirga sp.]|uniref:hypothetical protein n=1 Tax=Aestuariivirga sp. TaxID=2650926 RepID=UPI00359363D9